MICCCSLDSVEGASWKLSAIILWGLAHSRASMKPINNDESLINCCHISGTTQSQCRRRRATRVTSVKIEIDVVAAAAAATSIASRYCF